MPFRDVDNENILSAKITIFLRLNISRSRAHDDNFNVDTVIIYASRETLVLKTKQLIVHTEPCSLIQFKNYRKDINFVCVL